MKIRDFVTWRIIVLILALLITFIVINPALVDVNGVAIKSVNANSTAGNIGLKNPAENIMPRSREIIIEVNGEKIASINDYVNAISKINNGEAVRIKTNRQEYDPFLKDSQDLGIAVEQAAESNIRK